MRVAVIAGTAGNNSIVGPGVDMFYFLGLIASVCRSKDRLSAIVNSQSFERCRNRTLQCLNSKHDSISEHWNLTFYVEDCSKAFADCINSGVYLKSPTERSGRVQRMYDEDDKSGEELFNKWSGIFRRLLKEHEPEADSSVILSTAEEYARYTVSIFAKKTCVVYTMNIRELCYMCNAFIKFKPRENSEIEKLLKVEMLDFANQVKQFIPAEMFDALVDERHRFEYVTSNPKVGTVVYGDEFFRDVAKIPFAVKAQLIRARSLHNATQSISLDGVNTLGMSPQELATYYALPEPLKSASDELKLDWYRDLSKVKYPNAMTIEICISGRTENLRALTNERCCCHAMTDTRMATHDMLMRLAEVALNDKNDEMHRFFMEQLSPKCAKGYSCNKRGNCGPNNLFTSWL